MTLFGSTPFTATTFPRLDPVVWMNHSSPSLTTVTRVIPGIPFSFMLRTLFLSVKSVERSAFSMFTLITFPPLSIWTFLFPVSITFATSSAFASRSSIVSWLRCSLIPSVGSTSLYSTTFPTFVKRISFDLQRLLVGGPVLFVEVDVHRRRRGDLAGVDELHQPRQAERDVPLPYTGEVEGPEGHLGAGLAYRLGRHDTGGLARLDSRVVQGLLNPLQDIL